MDYFFEESHPLHGPLVRLNRAQEHIRSVDEVFRVFATSAYSVEREDDPGDPNRELFRARITGTPPPRLSVLVGECLFNLRSCLDHLAWQLALLTTPTPNERTEFPICTTRPGWESSRWKVADAPVGARWWIEGLQPFTRPKPKQTVLWLLSRLCNDDKHRAFITMAQTRYESHAIFLYGEDSKAGVIGGPMYDGKVVGWRTGVPAEKRAEMTSDRIDLMLAFGPGGNADYIPVQSLLGQIYKHLRYELLPAAAPFFGVARDDIRLHGDYLQAPS